MRVYCVEIIKPRKDFSEQFKTELCGIFSSNELAEKSVQNNIFNHLDDKHLLKINKCDSFDDKNNEYDDITNNRIIINECELDSEKFFEDIYPY